MSDLNLHYRTFVWSLLAITAVSLSACGTDDSNKCGAITEAKGQKIAKASLMRFLKYAGKTHSPLRGDGGEVDITKLERIIDSDLAYDGRAATSGNSYAFHLSWAPNAKFTVIVAPNCSTTNNWSVE